MQSTHETWKPIPGYEGSYSVSDHGRVRSELRTIQRSNGTPQTVRARILSPYSNVKSGHPTVSLSRGGTTDYKYVHSLVLMTFVGPRPDGLEARHLNDDATDNRLANLVYGTRQDNNYDRVANGIHHFSSRDVCGRGHQYVQSNLKTVARPDGGTTRRCRACDRMNKFVHKHPGAGVNRDELADQFYRAIVGGSR